MRQGWNPIRRNRNIGTKAQGHGSDNKLVIPESSREWKRFYEKLSSYVRVTRNIGARELSFFVEPTRPGWFYPCTIDDICAVLSKCAAKDTHAFDFVVLRQRTSKQDILNPVWGRAIWTFDIGAYPGPAVVIESQSLSPIRWNPSLFPDKRRELERLRADGHEIRRTRRGFEIHPSAASLRNTVLYRTLLHELGHHVDHLRSSPDEWGGKTSLQKEDYAHRYAQEAYSALEQSGVVPFPAMIDPDSLRNDHLAVEWFCAT